MNTLVVGGTGSGKTLSAARSIVESNCTTVVFDPHKHSLAETVLLNSSGNVLYSRLSDLDHVLGFDLLSPSTARNPFQRKIENQLKAEAFVEILMRRRGTDISSSPLMEEWVLAVNNLYLFQDEKKPLQFLPYAFMPGTDEFDLLIDGCTLTEVAYKFRQLEGMTPRGLRAEAGSAMRLINSVFKSASVEVRCNGGFNLGKFLQSKGTLIIERGDEISDDAMRFIMSAIVLLVVEHAKKRDKPYPLIQIVIDEATNARLVGGPELRGIAETRKNGLFWKFLVQNLDFPGGPDAVLQNCPRHEWLACPYYDLAHKAAADIAAGLPDTGKSRLATIDELTKDVMNSGPGWRWVRDPSGSRKEYVPLLEDYPNWPGLREAKLQEKLQWIYSRQEYGDDETPPSSSSCPVTPRPPSNLPGSSPAQRWKQQRKKRVDGS